MPVNLGGWFVTDDAAQPARYRIVNGTSIGGSTYLVLDETQIIAAAGTLRTFTLDRRGGEVYLFSGDSATNLTGYSHGFSFGAAAQGENFGRHVISTGEEQFPAQRTATLGGPNSGPRIGPVVITEIHYHPNGPGEDDEFIELQNISATNAALFDAAQPLNTWRLNGAGLAFPPGLELAPGQFALIVRIDPAVFAARHAVPNTVTIVGPFAGNLQNSGERLELQRPGPPDTNGVPFITVDEVRYNDRGGWPVAADGSGPSLQKRNAADYGNDPVNWVAAVLTPGRPRPGGTPPSIATPPDDQTVVASHAVSFRVVANGSGPLQFQWRFNGDTLPGATNAVLELTGVQPEQGGTYNVVVFNDAGSIESVGATLTVLRPASIVGHPLSVTLRGSTNAADYGSTSNRTAVFSVQAFSSTPLSFHWRHQGQPIASTINPTAITPFLIITNVTLADDGTYDVLVTDGVGEVASQPAQLIVLLTPQFVVPPVNLEVVAGGSFTASASIRGNPPPFTYQWRQGSAPIFFETTGDTNAFLVRTNVQSSQAGSYRLVDSNLASSFPNMLFSVTVLPDTDADGLPDAWETAYFGSATAAVHNLDSDGDGLSNLEEYLAGTDATNRLSYLQVESIAVGSGVLVRFGAISNRTYTLEFTDAVGQRDWGKLADLTARSTNWLATFVDLRGGTNRFYRLRTPRGQ